MTTGKTDNSKYEIDDILFYKPAYTLKETHAIITIRIPIEKRQDAYDFADRVKQMGERSASD